MNKLVLLYVLGCFAFSATAQQHSDSRVNYLLQQMPASATQSTATIAGYFNEHLTTPQQKLEAIHAWVSANIKYDTDSATIINWNANTQLRVTEAFRRRKGVCENYTAIFHDIARQCGLLTVAVDGYTKQHGTIDRSGHSWLAVQVNKEWLLCDPTWDKDNHGSYKYFLVPPAQLIGSHMPFDYLWQLLPYPITHAAFIKGNNNPLDKKQAWNVADSIAAYLALDSLAQLQAKKQRILQAGPANELVTLTAAATNFKIRVIEEEKMERLYNEAVSNFNKGLHTFNNYLQSRNEGRLYTQDIPPQQLLKQVQERVGTAKDIIRELETMYNNFQYDPMVLRNRISGLEERTRKELQDVNATLAGKK